MTGPDLSPGLAAILDVGAPIASRFADTGHRIYLVGGVVRDHLLGRVRDAQDLDATTDARPEEIKSIVADLAEAVWTQGERFGTIGCVVDGRTWEITTHRAEAYDPRSRKPTVTFGDHIEDDLARRDFTVNAMALDMVERTIVDPHGGEADLAAQILRTPLDPEISFSEDPLRMLRAARFHAGYGLEPAPGLTDAIGAMADRMDIVSAERIRDELQKLLLLDDPMPGLRMLAETGLLGLVVPRAGAHVDVERLGRRVGAVPADPAMRWAALLFDGGVTAADLRDLVFSGRMASEIVWFASSPFAADEPFDTGVAAARRAAAFAPTGRRIEDQLAFAAGVRTAGGLALDSVEAVGRVVSDLRRVEPDLDDPAPLLTGGQVGAALGLEPGPDIGLAMRWLRDLRLEEGPMTEAEATRRLTAWWPGRDDD